MADDITIGELARRLDASDRRTEDGFRRIEQRISQQQFVRADVFEVRMTDAHARIDGLEESKKWAVRLVIANVFMLILIPIYLLIVLGRPGP